MSAIQVTFSTPQDDKATAAQVIRPALSEATAATEKPPRSFASAAKPTAKPTVKPSAAAKEETPEQIARKNTAAWIKEMRAAGNVIGFFYVNPTRKEIESTDEGKVPSPANRKIEHIKKSIRGAIEGSSVRVITRDGKSKDGIPIRFKIFYVAMPLSKPDAKVFENTPLLVTEMKHHPSQTWTTEHRIKWYNADLPKFVSAAKARFADVPATDVDLGKVLPAEFNGKNRMPRCFGALWNVCPGKDKGQTCAKSKKEKEYCKWNREFLDQVAAGEKTTHGPCKYNHGTLEDAGVTADNYKVILTEWPLAVARQKAHMAEEAAKALKAAERKKTKAALKAQAAADEEGFETVVSGFKSSKTAPKQATKPAAAPKAANPFAGLEVKESEDEEIETVDAPLPVEKPAETAEAKPSSKKGKKKFVPLDIGL